MDHINWGIIAPGNIATKFAEAISHVDDATLYGVASRDINRASAFANKTGAQHVFESYKALVLDENIHVVYVASPHSFHETQALLALEHGKSVLCEKPITVNTQQAKRLFDAAEANTAFCMEAVWTRFMPTHTAVKKWIQEGRIGEIKLIKADFGFSFPFDPQGRLFDLNLAGGALLDLGIYPITFAQMIMGDEAPIKITADGILGETGVDEVLSMNLVYESGVIASLGTTSRANTNYTAEIYGTEGTIRVPLFWCAQSAELLRTQRTASEQLANFEHPHPCNGYEWEIIETHRCLRAGKLESDLMPWSASLGVMSIMDEVRSQIGLVYPFE